MTGIPERLAAVLADRYRIERELGAGGMATVYLAADLKHDRKVAIKVLKPELAAVLGAERFVQEIKTTAALSHPHILPLFDSGEAGGFLYYVMPFIEGETIRDRLNRETQLGIDEAVKITTEVADALDYAHRHGVIHRDIKPENILLHDGRPMVMDFGIALAVSAAAGGRMTETGLSLGTPHYMSPEQATAEKEITGRSDIYSLASVLYEMLAGVPPHEGGSAQQTIMRIITDVPRPVTELRKSVPPNVAAALGRALEKLPADRFDGAKAFAQALANPQFTVATAAATLVDRRRPAIPIAVLALATIALMVAGLAGGWALRGSATVPQLVRFAIPVSSGVNAVDVSADGSQVLFFEGQGSVTQVRRLGDDSLRPAVAGIFREHRISPDGRSVLGVTQDGWLVIASVGGGQLRQLVNVGLYVASGVWAPDGHVYFASPGGLARIPVAGGAVDTLVGWEPGGRVIFPMDVLPDGRTLLVFLRDASATDTVALFDLERRSVSPLFPAPSSTGVRYSATGHVVYSERNRILARSLDVGRGTVDSDTITLAVGPPETNLLFGIGGSTLSYVATGGTEVLMLADRQGSRLQLPNLPDGDYSRPRLSPRGDRIAVLRRAPNESGQNVWVYDLPAGPLSPLTRSGGISGLEWSADGQRVAYTRDNELYWRRFDAADDEVLLLRRERILAQIAMTADKVLFQESPGSWDIGIATLDAAGSDSLVLHGDYWEGAPSVSPDGRWLAYYSTEGGPPQVFVQPLLRPGRKVQVSSGGVVGSRWAGDSRRLFYVERGSLMEATLNVGQDLGVASVNRLFDIGGSQFFDVFPDGDRFVVTEPASGAPRAGGVTVVSNFDLLLRPGAAGRRD